MARYRLPPPHPQPPPPPGNFVDHAFLITDVWQTFCNTLAIWQWQHYSVTACYIRYRQKYR